MKVRIIIWSIVGLVVAAGIVILATSKSIPGGVEPEFSRDDLFAYAGRLDSRLAQTQRRFDKALEEVRAGAEADSLKAGYEEKIAACRALIDSIAMEQDVEAALGMKERADLNYGQAKDWLFALENLSESGGATQPD